MTDAAKVGRTSRRRGADAERAVVRYLHSRGHDARRYMAGDGKQPGDIDWHPRIVLEVKDVASSAWPTWCRQAAAAAGEGQVPVVVRRKRGEPDVGEWPCRLPIGSLPVSVAAYADGEGAWCETTLGMVVSAVEREDRA